VTAPVLAASRVRLAAFLVVASALAACGVVRVEGQPDSAAIPGGPLQAVGAEATGRIVEIGSGRTLGVGWRYAMYESADGICTQLELASYTTAGCGPLPLVAQESVFGRAGSGGTGEPDSPVPYDGIVSRDVVDVWLVTESGQQLATTLMSLAEAGHDASAFVGFAPPGEAVTGAVAVDGEGQVIETFDLD
jgi:hypothetical protein